MNTILKYLVLASAAGFPCVAFAEIAGAPLPAAINAQSALAVLAVAITLLIGTRDYARSFQPLPVNEVRPMPAPATSRSHAYGIRRGAEVARLAA